MSFTKNLINLVTKGDARSVLVKKNIILSFLLKGISIFVSLLYVPITLNYLNPTRYGIWMTLTSIVAWFGLFDIGLGNGLRNKLAEALANEDKILARKYVSTTYAVLSIVVIVLFILFLIGNFWIDWTIALNTTKDFQNELSILALIVFFSFCIKFVLQIISIVLIADQKPALGSAFEVIGSILGLVAIWILTHTNYTSLLSFGICVLIIPIIVLFLASIYFYNKKYSFLKPSFKEVEFIYAKDLAGLGIQFFIIQIAVLVIFQTSNILISQLFSPAEVTPYNIAFKYFSVITMIWGILMTPLWSAFTHAIVNEDFKWMRKTISKLNILMLFTLFIIIIMSLIANSIINYWTSNLVKIPIPMIYIFAIYTSISIWNNIYAFFLNGTNQVKIQIYTSIIASIIHIPIAIFLVKYFKMGTEGIVLSMIISLSLFAVAGPIKTFKILKNGRRIS